MQETLSPSTLVLASPPERAETVLLGTHSYRQLRKSVTVGVLFSTVPFVLFLGGLSLMPIPGAVIASGYLTSESAPKQIQSAQTAVVRAILVQDGDTVHAGQRLLQLDDTAAQSELAISSKTRDQAAARIARLDAEALNQEAISFPPELLARNKEPAVAAMLKAETELFQVRLQAYTSQLDQMREQSRQIDEQVKGVTGQIAAADRQVSLISSQIDNLQALRTKDLVGQSQLTTSQRDLATIQGQRAQLASTIATAKAQQAEIKGQISELVAKRMSDAGEQERETQGQYDQASEKQISGQMSVQQYVLTAPQDGVITDLRVRTVGGVVTTSQTLMTIVPQHDKLIAELNVSPRDVPHIHVGQPAELHFNAMGGSSAPQFSGDVTFVAPDLVIDQRTGVPHFVVRVAVDAPINEPAKRMQRLGSGMPVDVYILSKAQPIISYIGKPIIEQAQRAFR
jgi:HlyD family secretion protein